MWFYSLVFFLLVAVLSAGYFFKVQKESYWTCLLLLMIMAGFRPQSCCLDYDIYVDYYGHLSGIPLTFLEPTFFLIAEISRKVFGSPIGVFIIYCVLGVTLKGIAFVQLTKYYSVSLILYFGSFFLLHEMTQIRVGVASGILLLSVPSIVDRDWKKFLVYMVVGILFHYSFIVFAFCYFFDPRKINPWLYFVLIVITYAAVMAGINITSVFQFLRLGFISDKIDTYKMLLEEGMFGGIMLINPLLFLRIIILFVFLWNWELLLERNRYAVVLMKIYAFSIFFFIAFADLPVMAGRVSQLLGIVEIVVVPFAIYLLTPKFYAVALAVLFAMLIMYKQLYYSDLLNSYF